MTIVPTDGSLTTTTSEQTIVDLIGDQQYSLTFFLHNMTGSDSFTVKVYLKDQNGGALRIYETEVYTGPQAEPAFYVAPLLTKEFKVTIQRTAGSDRVVTWQAFEVT